MAKATYRLRRTNEDLDGIVDSREQLERTFKHRLPRGTRIEGHEHIRIGELEIPRVVTLWNKYSSGDLPKTKISGLYELV